MACWAVECLSSQARRSAPRQKDEDTSPRGKRACARQLDHGHALGLVPASRRASSCSSRSRPCRRPPARPTIRSPCACGVRASRRRRRGGPRLSRGLSRRLDNRLRGSATATEHRSKSSSVTATRGVGSTAGSAGVRATEHRRKGGRGKSASRRRVWFRKAAPHLATLGSCSWKAQGTRLQGRCGSMNWNVAPFAHCSSASLRCRASRSAFSRALLVAGRGAAAVGRRARLARELVRQVDLFGQVALLALFVGVAVGDRPRRGDAPRSPAFCSGSRRWRRFSAPR